MRIFNRLKNFLFFKIIKQKEFNQFKRSIVIERSFFLENGVYQKDKYYEFKLDYHYLYHPVWAFKLIVKNKPNKHIDVSSINYFSAFLSTFIPTVYYEYRKPDFEFRNLTVLQGDLLKLPIESDSVDSISCMHTLEHIGLGRYGDIVDYDGDLKAAKELKRVVKKGGFLYLVVPVGKPRILFNSHRIYSFEMIRTMFSEFDLREFSIILDNGKFEQNADSNLLSNQNYSCGCFWFSKK